jgi:uncharacterized membrane protein YfcA
METIGYLLSLAVTLVAGSFAAAIVGTAIHRMPKDERWMTLAAALMLALIFLMIFGLDHGHAGHNH